MTTKERALVKKCLQSNKLSSAEQGWLLLWEKYLTDIPLSKWQNRTLYELSEKL